MIPFIGIKVPAIAAAAIFGILLNLLFLLIETFNSKKENKKELI